MTKLGKPINLCDGGERCRAVAEEMGDGGERCRAVAEEMGDGRTQIMNILKRRREILCDFQNNVPSSRKRIHRVNGNENINGLCWDWFQDFSN